MTTHTEPGTSQTPSTLSCSTCGGANQTHRCHRCHTNTEVRARYVITNTMPCLAGVQPKATGYQTWACDPCWNAFQTERTP